MVFEIAMLALFMVIILRTMLISDLTIAYYPTSLIPPTLLQIFSLNTISPFYKVHVHIRKYEINQVVTSITSSDDH